MPDRFLHGSPMAHAEGTVLRGRGEAYVADWQGTGFHAALERWRPADALPQGGAVFMVGSLEDLDVAGGSTEWCLEVVPEGTASRHDLNWTGAIAALVEGGLGVDDPAVEAAARAYWAGDPSPDETVWEYLASAVRVVRCDRPDAFEDGAGPAP
jgi:hypothetical protein